MDAEHQSGTCVGPDWSHSAVCYCWYVRNHDYILRTCWPLFLIEQSGDVEEGVKAKQIRQPHQPSRLEIEEHELTHVPFREWCVHCCKGKARSSPHKVNKEKELEDKENAVTTISMDYMFMNEKGAEDANDPILVLVDRKTKAIMGHVVKCKGTKDEWAMKRVMLDISILIQWGT